MNENSLIGYVKVYDYATCSFKQRLPSSFVSNGLVQNSEEWWRAIAIGNIETHWISGPLTRIWIGPPYMTARYRVGKGKSKFVSVRLGEPDELYRVGNQIRIKYAIVQARTPRRWPDGTLCEFSQGFPCVLEEWIKPEPDVTAASLTL